MAIKINDVDIQDVKLGNTQVLKIMLGSEQVWPSSLSITTKFDASGIAYGNTMYTAISSGTVTPSLGASLWVKVANPSPIAATAGSQITSTADGSASNIKYIFHRFDFPILQLMKDKLPSDFWGSATTDVEMIEILRQKTLSIVFTYRGKTNYYFYSQILHDDDSVREWTMVSSADSLNAYVTFNYQDSATDLPLDIDRDGILRTVVNGAKVNSTGHSLHTDYVDCVITVDL